MHPEFIDRLEIRELIENWVVWRDSGDWDQLRTTWFDDGRLAATWHVTDDLPDAFRNGDGQVLTPWGQPQLVAH